MIRQSTTRLIQTLLGLVLYPPFSRPKMCSQYFYLRDCLWAIVVSFGLSFVSWVLAAVIGIDDAKMDRSNFRGYDTYRRWLFDCVRRLVEDFSARQRRLVDRFPASRLDYRCGYGRFFLLMAPGILLTAQIPDLASDEIPSYRLVSRIKLLFRCDQEIILCCIFNLSPHRGLLSSLEQRSEI